MCYVPTKSEMSFIRSERDLGGFERAYRKRHGNTVACEQAISRNDVIHEHRFDDEGQKTPFTVILRASDRTVIKVVDGHI